MLAFALAAALMAGSHSLADSLADSLPVREPRHAPVLASPVAAAVTFAPAAFADDTVKRQRAITYSDWYGHRLTVHRYGSYVMLPLFVAQFALGNSLLGQKDDLYAGTRQVPVDRDLLTAHKVVAGSVGTLFVLNTTTGLWNLYAARKDPAHKRRRITHALTMLTADAGFVTTGLVARDALKHGPPAARKHRNIALGSMGVATLGASLMWFSNHD